MWQLSRIYDQIDLVTTSLDQYKRISPLVGNLLSQLAICNDCSRMLDFHRPKIREEGFDQEVQRLKRHWSMFLSGISRPSSADTMKLATVAFPKNNFMMPKGPKSIDWANRCLAVNEAFDTFWKAADAKILTELGTFVFNLGSQVARPRARIDWLEIGAVIIWRP